MKTHRFLQKKSADFFFYRLAFLVSFILVSKQTFASGTYTVGTGQTYTTLKAAFDAVNAGTISGTIVLQIAADCSETATASLNASGSGSASYTSITIYPTGVSRTISATLASSLITLNGADNVTIDGRVNQTGSTQQLTIENTSTSASAYTLVLQSDATNNTLKYCTLKGSTTSASKGVLTLLTATSTGNNSNTISYNIITKSGSNQPTICLYDGGTSGKENNNNTISNNSLVDFSKYGYYIYAYSNTYSITGNSFYQSASFTPANDIYMLYIYSGGLGGNLTGFTITGNYFGGQAASCGGSAYTLSSSAYKLYIFSCDAGSTAGTWTISGNTVQNIALTSTATSNIFTVFNTTGVSSNQTFTFGSSGNGNIIGATSGTGSISITSAAASSVGTAFSLFYTSCISPTTIAYNKIGSISYSTTATAKGDMVLIYHSASTAVTIDNNTFGNTTANNINLGTNSSNMQGIYVQSSTGAISIYGNTFQNWNNSGNQGTNDYAISINSSSPGNINIYNNAIKNFSSANTFIVEGIYLGSSINTSNAINVYGNTLSNITKSSTSGSLYNLYFSYSSGTGNPTINVYKNMIKGFGNASTTASDFSAGIYASISAGSSPTVNIYNNVILSNDAGNTTAKTLRGILDYIVGASSTVGIYHNTVKLYATYTSGTGTSAAFTFGGSNTGTHYIKNNIWQNTSSGGSGVYMAQRYLTTTTLSNVNHNYNESSSSASLIYYNSANRTLATWQGASYTNTTSEISGSISLSSTTGVPSSSTSVGNAGTPIALVTDDYNSSSRSVTAPWIGAYESITALPIELVYFTGKPAEQAVDLSWETSSERNNDFFTVERTSDGIHFETIANIKGKGNKTSASYYSITDPTPFPGVSYYRLSQTDFDGHTEYFNLISVAFNTNPLSSEKIYPNPVANASVFHIPTNDPDNTVATMDFYSFSGILIRSEQISSENNLYSAHTANLHHGNYIIVITTSLTTKKYRLTVM